MDSQQKKLIEDYWHARLSSTPRPLSIGRGGQGLQSTLSQNLPAGTTARLRGASKGSTLGVAILGMALLEIVLRRYANTDDIALATLMPSTEPSPNGSPANGSADIPTNVIVCRTLLDAKMSVAAAIDAVKITVQEAMAHGQYPYLALRERLRQRQAPLPDDVPNALFRSAGLHVNSPAIAATPSLIFTLDDSGDDGTVSLAHTLASTDGPLLQRLLASWAGLVAGFTPHLSTSLAKLPVIPSEERRRILALAAAPANWPTDATIPSLFDQTVRQHAARTAVSFDGRSLSYAELDARARRLAAKLRDAGVERNQFVALLVEPSLDLVIAILAVIKAGAAYVPIDPDLPDERIHFILQDCAPRALIASRPSAADRTPAAPCFLVNDNHAHDDAELAHEHAPHLHLPHGNAPDDLLYAIYTSGTTGQPKGVLVEHRHVVRLLFNDRFPFRFTHSDTWTLFHSYAFDFSVWELFGALLTGGRLVVVPKMIARDPAAFAELVLRERVSVLNQTPSAFYHLMHADQRRSARADALRYVIFGGEALDPGKLAPWRQRYPDVVLVNMYGITETTVHVTYKEIDEDAIATHVRNIGRAIPTSSIYIVDHQLDLVPLGVPGELCVGGEGIARGYLHRDELTASRFVANPFAPGERLYRSGDRVRLLESGDLEYLGRIDTQVKVRGFRIEPAEIEARLESHPAVVRAVVVARANDHDETSLCAYVELEERTVDPQPLIDALRAHLARFLPEYMLPSQIVPLDRMPLTPNGKLDRSALPPPRSDAASIVPPPRSHLEAKLRAIWESVIGAGNVSMDRSFFDAGGDSIRAIRLVGLVNDAFGTQLRIPDLYAHDSLAALSALLADAPSRSQERAELAAEFDRLRETLVPSPLSLYAAAPLDDVYPASDIEHAMLHHGLKAPREAIYHDQLLYQLSVASFDVARFRRALELLANKHCALRSRFVLDAPDGPLHLVETTARVVYHHEELLDMDARQQALAVHAWLARDRNHPFVADRAPLWRMQSFDCGHGRLVLVLVAHHAILDGWSASLFMRELDTLYRRLLLERDFRPSPLRCRHREHILEQFIERRSPEAAAFWRSELRDFVPRVRFTAPPNGEPSDPRVVCRALPNDLAASAREAASARGTSLKTLCLSAYLMAVSMFQFHADLLVGIVSHDRPACLDGDRLLGCFLNTIPFRFRVPAAANWLELLHSVESRLLAIRPFERLPLADIIRLAGVDARHGNPLFSAIFNFTDFGDDAPLLAPGAGHLDVTDHVRTDMLLAFTVDATGHRLRVVLGHVQSAWPSSDALRLCTYFERALHLLVHDPVQPVRKFDLMDDREQHAIVAASNGTGRDVALGPTVSAAFMAQVTQTPERTALVWDDGHLTYAELAARAQRIASVLRASGVVRETVVALLAPRSADLVAAVLGILAAGGAYLPLDPELPDARIDEILTSADVAHLVTTSATLAERALSWPHGARLPAEGASRNVLALDRLDSARTPTPTFTPTAPVPAAGGGPEDLLYLISTSGSTGKPKCVMVEHFTMLNLAQYARDHLRLPAVPKVLQLASIGFDVSAQEILTTLLIGGELHLIPPAARRDVSKLLALIERRGVDVVYMTPTLLEALFADREMAASVPACIRHIIAGGEALIVGPLLAQAVRDGRFALHNHYGPSETHLALAAAFPPGSVVPERPPVGTPVPNFQLFVLDENGMTQPLGAPGEIHIGGRPVGRGYYGRDDLTRERYRRGLPDAAIPAHRWPAGARAERIYRSGDFGRWNTDGTVAYLGRLDHQVKIRGFRIELEEIESTLRHHPSVHEAVVLVLASADVPERKRLIAYVTGRDRSASPTPAILLAHAARVLPPYMVPNVVVVMDALPLTRNGKVDRNALAVAPLEQAPSGESDPTAPHDAIEATLARLVAEVLGVPRVGIRDRFFEAGATSLDLIKLQHRLERELAVRLPIEAFFGHPTIEALAAHLRAVARSEAGGASPPLRTNVAKRTSEVDAQVPKIAIIGMAGRFPGASTLDELWQNILEGRDCIARFAADAAHVSPFLPEGPRHPRFVGAEGIVGETGVDEELWRPSAETRALDGQSKLALDCVLAAFEDAGYDPWTYPGRVALYGGASSVPLAEALATGGRPKTGNGIWALGSLSPETMALRMAHTFGFRGEAVNVNTTCSTGLAAVHLACQSLSSGHNELAVAVAASIPSIQAVGYVHEDGAIASKDGYVRAFDARASGTVSGHGVAAVLLKPLELAVRDGDAVYAVIRATAMNNDGRAKVGYTAPSVEGQAEVISAAHALARIRADEVGYVEAHGTGTPLGDPVELAGLTRAFRQTTNEVGYCALGTVKANIGHLAEAAGLAGLIKTALVLHHGSIPPLAHFREPNPELRIETSPFSIPTEPRAWPRGERPRIAGVSSFGVGGTNVHAVLEDAPLAATSHAVRKFFVLQLTARTEEALERAGHEVASVLESASRTEVADTVFTLDTQRLKWPVSRTVVGPDGPSLARALRERREVQMVPKGPIRIAYVYTGIGTLPARLGAELYATEPVFRHHLDLCHERFARAGFDVRGALTQAPPELRFSIGAAGAALFAFETGLQRLLESAGIRPSCVIGHSFGEYAAAYCANVLSFEDALEVVIARCRAMESMPEGVMLATTCTPGAAVDFARRAEVEIAAFNGPTTVVFSGGAANIERLRKELRSNRVASVQLDVNRALHSKDVNAVLAQVVEAFSAARLRSPSLGFISTATGAAESERLTVADYWAEQMRGPVRFVEAVHAARAAGMNVFIEIGPTGSLVPFIVANAGAEAVGMAAFRGDDLRAPYDLMGRLLDLQCAVDWSGWYAGETRRRVRVPLHPRPHARAITAITASRAVQGAARESLSSVHPYDASARRPSTHGDGRHTIEERVALLWQRCLKLPTTMDHHAHFIELGGSSLLAVHLVAEMRETFGVDFGLAELFATPTVHDAARFIASRIDARTSLGEATAGAGTSSPVLSAVQKRALAVHFDPHWGPKVVNMSIAVRIRGPIDVARVARALKSTVERHEVLHTKLVVRPEGDTLDTLDTHFRSSDVQLASVACDAEGTEARLAEVRSAMGERIAQHFDLSREIPVRAFLFHVGSEDHILLLVIHHIAADASSIAIVLQDVLRMYRGMSPATGAPRYSVFAAEQAVALRGADGAAHMARWNAIFEGSPRMRALLDSDEGPRADTSLVLPLGPEIGRTLAEVRKRHGVSTFVALASALAIALRDALGSPESIISTPNGNRDRADRTDLVGYVAHGMIMVLRADLAGEPSGVLREMQRTFSEALGHSRMPFEHWALARQQHGVRPFSDLCLIVHEDVAALPPVGKLAIEPFAYEMHDHVGGADWSATMGTIGAIIRLERSGHGVMSLCFPRHVLGSEAKNVPHRLATALERLLDTPETADTRVPTFAAGRRSPLALRLDGVALSHTEVDCLTGELEDRLRATGITTNAIVDVVYRNRAELVVGALSLIRLGACVTVGRTDASKSLSLHPNDGPHDRDGEPGAISVEMPLGRNRAPRFDRDAIPISEQSVRQAGDIMPRESPGSGAHVVWDEELPDNRALAFAIAAIQAGGLVSDLRSVTPPARRATERTPLSLAYFPVDDGAPGEETYRLFIEGAKRADDAGLRGVFAPERHFHPFGGSFPDPLVAAATLAGATKRIELRAGSLVLPLHDPLRVAESWGMLDVLSGGRVGLSIATGWRMEDFVLAPSMFARRKQSLTELLELVRALWRGEAIERIDPEGRTTRIRTRPRPLRPELPVWLTCAGSPGSFTLAGQLGTAVFTMLGPDIEGQRKNIAAYRESFARHWNGATGHVTVLVSTFIHRSATMAREMALAPLERYLAWSLDIGEKELTASVSKEIRNRFLRQKAERVIEREGLIGNLSECERRLESLVSAGADEIACLVDFGIPRAEALEGIDHIVALAERAPKRTAHRAHLPAPVPLEHRGRPEVWLLSKSSAKVAPAAHRTILVEDEHLCSNAYMDSRPTPIQEEHHESGRQRHHVSRGHER